MMKQKTLFVAIATVLLGFGLMSLRPADDVISKEDGLTDLIMAGHIHFYHRDFMSPKTVQTVTPPAFERGVIKITLY